MNHKGELLTQHWSTIYQQYWDVDKYRLLPTDYDNTWSNMYADVLADLEEAIKLSEADANDNAIGVAEILKVYTYSVITDCWGDVPYSEALDIESTFTPVYDSQRDIYLGLIAQLESASAKLSGDEEATLTTQDVIFNGNLNLWKSFANTLKLRLLMRISDTDAFDAGKVSSLVSGAALIASNDENGVFTYGTSDGNFNPLYERFNTPGRSRDLSASATMVDQLKSLNDPRLDAFFDISPDTTVFVGNPNGYGAQIESNYAHISYSWWEPGNAAAQTRPTLLITAAESYLLQAEAVALGYATGDAADLYAKAISASMEQWGVDQAAADDYIAANPYVDINSIYLQKWIALFDQGAEAYSSWRKADYPELPVAANSQNGDRIPVRFPYPYDEISTNADNVPDTDINTKLWWDKN